MRRLLLAALVTLTAAAPPPPPPLQEESNGRIVNGVPALPGSARWQVELRRASAYPDEKPFPDWQRRHSCGGVLIAPTYVLTAAHCVTPKAGLDLKADYVVRAGSLDLRNPMREYRIVRIVIDERYRETRPPAHDIALVEIALRGAAIPVAEEPTPIALPGAGVVLPATARVTVTGWGLTAAAVRGSSPSGLLAAVLRLIPAASCTVAGTNRPIDPAQHLCAGPNDPARPADSCQGDSGGPLTWQGPGRRWYLVGLVSWGPEGVCGGGSPGIYTNVATHLDWIAKAKTSPEGFA